MKPEIIIHFPNPDQDMADVDFARLEADHLAGVECPIVYNLEGKPIGTTAPHSKSIVPRPENSRFSPWAVLPREEGDNFTIHSAQLSTPLFCAAIGVVEPHEASKPHEAKVIIGNNLSDGAELTLNLTMTRPTSREQALLDAKALAKELLAHVIDELTRFKEQA